MKHNTLLQYLWTTYIVMLISHNSVTIIDLDGIVTVVFVVLC